MTLPEELSVSIPREHGAEAGRVEAVVSLAEGVRVEACFPAEGAPLLAVGRAVELELARRDSLGVARALGKVIHRRDAAGVRAYQFLLGERTGEALADLLDPRRSPRLRPRPGEPVEATVRVPGDAEPLVTARVRDVSLGGLGLEVPWELEARLAEHTILEIGLRLPGEARVQRFKASVRGRFLGAGSVAYGLELARGAGVDRAAFDALAAYIAGHEPATARGPRRSA
ncbi:MAG: PilZ domain-containing protein [Planctomycetota bacterium]|nr:PilZ domain-containing protein [Planctomycetota bacterium]MEC8495570.1 PilZ domain-containing protein [Planctomycetota bacterium]MEC8510608.1 PilZ domain-containing protein [Planctomycetota bacterium]MEE2940077.1 PilZ domain-containing protein [Planctomycetota bacterium]